MTVLFCLFCFKGSARARAHSSSTTKLLRTFLCPKARLAHKRPFQLFSTIYILSIYMCILNQFHDYRRQSLLCLRQYHRMYKKPINWAHDPRLSLAMVPFSPYVCLSILQGNLIDDDLVRMLMTGLVKNSTITYLDVSHNKITNHGRSPFIKRLVATPRNPIPALL